MHNESKTVTHCLTKKGLGTCPLADTVRETVNDVRVNYLLEIVSFTLLTAPVHLRASLFYLPRNSRAGKRAYYDGGYATRYACNAAQPRRHPPWDTSRCATASAVQRLACRGWYDATSALCLRLLWCLISQTCLPV